VLCKKVDVAGVVGVKIAPADVVVIALARHHGRLHHKGWALNPVVLDRFWLGAAPPCDGDVVEASSSQHRDPPGSNLIRHDPSECLKDAQQKVLLGQWQIPVSDADVWVECLCHRFVLCPELAECVVTLDHPLLFFRRECVKKIPRCRVDLAHPVVLFVQEKGLGPKKRRDADDDWHTLWLAHNVEVQRDMVTFEPPAPPAAVAVPRVAKDGHNVVVLIAPILAKFLRLLPVECGRAQLAVGTEPCRD